MNNVKGGEMKMTNQDAIRWLDNLKNDIGNPHYERLWPYAQAIDEIMELLEEQDKIIQNILLEKANELNDKATTLQIEAQNREIRRR